MVFGIDFDGTFAADPAVFRAIVALLRGAGHTAVLVSQRCKKFEAEMRAVLGLDDLPIVFASGWTKERAAHAAGYTIDVWIDDNPYSIDTALVYRGCEEQANSGR